MKFDTLSLASPILRALQANRYHTATPIQQQAIPHVLEGQDLLGCAQTGTGKTAAFAVPTLQQLLNRAGAHAKAHGKRPRIRALILAPTRELAGQIGESFGRYGRFTHLKHAVIYGGVGQGPQVRALQAGVDILVATPGRLLDLIGQGFVRLDLVEILILDEADRMLDMGFIHDLRKIVAHVPHDRQTLMFSATMPEEIRRLAAAWLRKPVHVRVTPVASTPDKVQHSVYFVEPRHKSQLLAQFLQQTRRQRTLVFTRTKRGADKVTKFLRGEGIRAVAIHGDKSQGARQAAIEQFKSTQPPVLVATDIAARGLDFSDISHVVNYDLPEVPETYVHRIGRTARCGAEGCAVSFCGGEERPRLKLIERLMGRTVAIEQMPSDLPAVDRHRPNANQDSAQSAGRRRHPQPPSSAAKGAGRTRRQYGPAHGQRKRRRVTRVRSH